MKKVFLTMMMLLFAVTGVMRAQTLTVYDGTTTNNVVPMYVYYFDDFTKSQYVIPAADLAAMDGGMINSITYYTNSSYIPYVTASTVDIYLTEVDYTSISAYVDKADAQVVYTGTVEFVAAGSGGQATITFTTPYQYNGGNLLIGCENLTDAGFKNIAFYGQTVSGASIGGSNGSSAASAPATQRNFIPKVTFEYIAGGAATVTTDPAVLDLGYRPNGAWMAPFTFDLVNNGGAINVTTFSFNNSYFTANAELPAAVYPGNPLTVEVTTGDADPGTVSTEMLVLFDGGRNFETFNITAEAYDPVDGDVWENAIDVTDELEPRTDYNTSLPAGIYKNYELPDNTTDPDGVFKVSFDEDVLFYAATEAGNTYIYNEDFEGVGGPAADNNYEYDGPSVNPGPMNLWFTYEYTGTNTNLGYNTAGNLFYGYEIPATKLQELNLGNCAITEIESAIFDYSGTFLDFFILKGGDAPDLNNLVYEQLVEDYQFGYIFTLTLDEPQFLGDDENIWIMFYTDNTRLLCGRNPIDPMGQVWYSRDASTWYNNVSYTPYIFTHFIELPTGREVAVNTAELNLKDNGSSEGGELTAIDCQVQGVSHAQNHIATRGDRTAVQTLTVHDGTTTNNYVPVYGTWTDSFLKCEMVYPATELSDMNAGTINGMKFYASQTNVDWGAANFQVFVSEVTNATIDNFAGPGTIVYEGALHIVNGEMNVTFTTPYTYNGGNLLVGFYNTVKGTWSTSSWYGEAVTGASVQGYSGSSLSAVSATQRNFLPKTTFTYSTDSGSGGGGGGGEPTPYEPYVPGFTAQIDGMYLPAGTYYVVSASNITNAMVNMAYADVPVPDVPVIVTPDPIYGQQGVTAPYLLEWTLGNYTTEMQVLCGTQYPPTTVLIDWTDELVESAFVMDLLHNKNYFVRVNARNAAGMVSSDVAFFSTVTDPVEGFEGAESYLYPGDAAEFTWQANERTLIGYNLYYFNNATSERVLVNEDGPITGTSYSVEDLGYNNEAMGGYDFFVRALYSAGESDPSDVFVVYMTGTTTISGTVYDQDSVTVIPFAEIEFRGTDEYGADQVIACTADENGQYTCEVLVGEFIPYVVSAAYDPENPAAAEVTVVYDTPQTVDLYTHEFYFPLGMITATLQEEENNVLVEWDWTPASLEVDFETGDFSQAEFILPAQYPWVITTTNPYEGTYCMKSSCEGVASATSSIEATVEVPFEAGKMGFYVRTSSESNFDKFHFYIDGVEQGAALSGNNPYAYKEYSVSGGTHTYKWEYGKDSSVNSNDDCIYVDNITMYRQDVPLPPLVGATEYNFDDQTMMGWTSIDADGDGNGWVSSANPGIYHNSGVSLSGTGHNASEAYVISGSYANQTMQALTPDNYLVSPTQISAENGAQIQFWACAQDASYAAEHFGVAVSTTTATAAAFTTIQQWDMTAKGPQGTTAENVRDIRGTRQGNWYLYTADLSAYAGQDIWVAIRHFNCTDQFILNVDDITLADGSAKPMVRNDRSFQGFNLYRRDLKNGEEAAVAELIATPAADVFEYIDNDWATLDYGMWQWGIQATYEGNAPTAGDRDVITCDFESGLPTGWTVLDANSDGYTWCLTSAIPTTWTYYASMTLDWYHNGTNAICSGSYINGVGAITPDDYLVTPQVNLGAGSSISFWAAATDEDYPADHFGVFVSDNGTSGWTMVSEWTLDAKGGGHNGGRASRDGNGAKLGTWNQFTADLSAYTGQKYVAIRHFNCNDQYIMCVDDIELTTGGTTPPPTPPTPPTPAGSGLSEILWSNILEKDMEANVTVNVMLNNNQDPTGAVVTFEGPETYTATVDATGVVEFENFRKGDYTYTVALEGYTGPEGEAILVEEDMNLDVILYEIIAPVEDLYTSPTGWAMWAGGTAGGGVTPTPPGPTGGQWYSYVDTPYTGIGDSGPFYWAVMFPAGSYEGNAVTKVATYGTHNDTYGTNGSFSGSVTIYNDGTTAPATAVGTMDITMPDTDELVEFEFPTPVIIDPSKNLWIVFYDQTSSDYVASAGTSTAGNNAEWVSEDGTAWFTLTDAGLTGYGWTIRAYVAQGAKGEVVEIEAPRYNPNHTGTLSMIELGGAKGDRVALSYKVKLDGKFEGETVNPYWQHNVEGFEAGSEHVTSVAPLYATGLGDWMDYTWIYTPCDEYGGVENYTATADGSNVTLNWTVNATPAPGPTPPPTGTTTYDFDNGTMMGWTTIDANNDNYDWVLGSQIGGIYLVSGASLAGSGHNSSADLVCSGSYSNATGIAITPDNYLVSPAKAAYTNVSFWACAQDASYYQEHFGVFVSTGGATASEFTMVQEWDMTTKGEGAMGVGRDGHLRAQGSWHEYTADLSAYAGQEIWVAIRHFNCNDQFILDVDDITLGGAAKGNRAMWDIVYEFDATSGYQYGVASDGTNIYTSSWSASSTSMFYKYDMQGNFIEEFNISGCGQLRGMTYDGQYFYGVANSSTIYCVDLANHTLISSTPSAYGAMRCITYDPERDGFWVVGNWEGNLTLVSRAGAIVQTAGAPSSASDIAYYKDPEGVEHIYYLKNATGNGELYEYNITTNTMGTTPLINCSSNSNWTGSSGGCFVGTYNDKTCFFADAQQTPQHIVIYELDASSTPTPPTPPTPGEYLGVYVFRDGELISGQTPLTANTYTDSNVEAGEHEYCVRVVYSDYAMSCPECETVTIGEVSCDPVTNLAAVYHQQTVSGSVEEGALLTWDAPAGATAYKVYYGTQLLGQTTETSMFIYGFDEIGSYTFGVVAVHADCESDMVTVDFYWDAIGENEIVNNIYPNPTNDKVTIEAQGMNHITVASALGQVVYDADVNADQIELNLGQYNAGLYLVRISTVNGVSVKRVSVVK